VRFDQHPIRCVRAWSPGFTASSLRLRPSAPGFSILAGARLCSGPQPP
jgi:hypothetical protein